MKLSPNEIIEKLATVAGFSDEETQAFLGTINQDAIIEGDLGKSILTKAGTISSLDFLLNDPTKKEEMYSRVMRESMPKVEGGTKTAFLNAYADSLTEAEIDKVWNDPENKKLNNKVFKANELIKSKFQDKIKQAEKGPDELHQQINTYKVENDKLQSIIDSIPSKHEAEINELKRGFTEQLFSYKLVQDIKEWGGDTMGMERGIAMQINTDYYTGIDENGLPFLRQKANPESKITDPNSGVTLTYEQVIKRDFPNLFSRNNGNQSTGNSTTEKPKQSKGQSPAYPAHIKSSRQREQYDRVQARRNGAK